MAISKNLPFFHLPYFYTLPVCNVLDIHYREIGFVSVYICKMQSFLRSDLKK